MRMSCWNSGFLSFKVQMFLLLNSPASLNFSNHFTEQLHSCWFSIFIFMSHTKTSDPEQCSAVPTLAVWWLIGEQMIMIKNGSIYYLPCPKPWFKYSTRALPYRYSYYYFADEVTKAPRSKRSQSQQADTRTHLSGFKAHATKCLWNVWVNEVLWAGG